MMPNGPGHPLARRPDVATGGRLRCDARFDQECCRGQPERGEQEAAEDVGRVMLAPVHAGYGHENGHGDRGDEEQPSPPAAAVPDDQDRDGDVEAARGGLVPGGIRRGGQVPVELRDVRPGPVDHGRGDQEGAELAGHDRGDEDDRPPAPGDGEEHHAGGERDDEDRLGRPERAEDLAPVGPAGRAVSGEPVRDRPVAQHVAVTGLGDQLADADDDAHDQHPGHQDSRGDTTVVAAGPSTGEGFWPGRLQVGVGLGFQSFGDRGGHGLAGRAAGQLEGEGRDPEPGDAERPRTHDVGQVVHAEEDSADPDQGDECGDHRDEDGAPPAAGGGQEDEEYRSVADDRAE